MNYKYAVEYRPTTKKPWGQVSTWEFNPRLFSIFLEYFLESVGGGQHARQLYRVRRVSDDTKAQYHFSGFNHRRAA